MELITLTYLVENIENIDDDEKTIYLQKPWTPESLAVVDYEPDDGSIPLRAKELEAEYFLEVFQIVELKEDLPDLSGTKLVERIIQYRINDA